MENRTKILTDEQRCGKENENRDVMKTSTISTTLTYSGHESLGTLA
jgi:hypothetical protein